MSTPFTNEFRCTFLHCETCNVDSGAALCLTDLDDAGILRRLWQFRTIFVALYQLNLEIKAKPAAEEGMEELVEFIIEHNNCVVAILDSYNSPKIELPI
jgi:hypothetical protein